MKINLVISSKFEQKQNIYLQHIQQQNLKPSPSEKTCPKGKQITTSYSQLKEKIFTIQSWSVVGWGQGHWREHVVTKATITKFFS